MKEHHLQLNLAKTELLVFPATPTLHHDFTIQLGSSTITPSASVRNLGVIFDGQLTFKEHIAKTARSCRFALHNIRKIRPFLTEHAAQLLVQALVISRLDYCNALLAGLPSNTIKPLQMIQNAAARLVFNEPKRAHVTPLFVSLHWLPVAARIQFKTLMLAYRTTTGSAPSYFHSLLWIYIHMIPPYAGCGSVAFPPTWGMLSQCYSTRWAEQQCGYLYQSMSAIEAPRAKAQEEATPLVECALTPRGHGKRRAW